MDRNIEKYGSVMDKEIMGDGRESHGGGREYTRGTGFWFGWPSEWQRPSEAFEAKKGVQFGIIPCLIFCVILGVVSLLTIIANACL